MRYDDINGQYYNVRYNCRGDVICAIVSEVGNWRSIELPRMRGWSMNSSVNGQYR